MGTRNNRRRIAVAIAGAAVVVFAGAALAAAGSSQPVQAPHTARTVTADLGSLAQWAHVNGMTGLSPAGLHTNPAATTTAQIATWAQANQLSGLSPAGLKTARP